MAGEMYAVTGEALTDIANAIRSKTGDSAKLSLGEMADSIEGLRCGDDTETIAKLNAVIDRSIVEIRSDVEKIGDYAFHSCSQLTTADFPVTKSIGLYAFRGCSQLTTADFPLATSIGDGAFYNCSKLTTADFPAVTTIGNYAFRGCSKLNALALRYQSLCSLSNSNAFSGTPISSGTGHIYVPSSLVDTYKSKTNWSTYATQFRALEDYTVDGTITGELDADKIGA